MTMLDDDRLASLLARAAETFEVPVTGPHDIVARASGRGRRPLRGRATAITRTSATPTPTPTPTRTIRTRCRSMGQRRTVACAAWPAWPAVTVCSRSPPAS